MKKVVLILSAAALSAAFVSCKNDKPTSHLSTDEVPEEIVEVTSQDLALADISEENASTTNYLYVTAYNGLSLREYNNLQSERLAKMPYGTKVKVVTAEGKNTMNVAGIRGAMDEIEFNHKTGFAFNGYLSKYFPPERDISAKGYANQLQELFPEVGYEKTTGGTASVPETTETITLPEAQWHEAFFTAQRLFDFPKEFDFPKPKGKASEVIFDGKHKGSWTSQLEVNRADDQLEKIAYVYKSDKYDRLVSITPSQSGMVITLTETVK